MFCWLQPAQKFDTTWGQSRRQAEANAANTGWPHDVGRPSAAPHHMVAAAFGGRLHVVIHHVGR